MRKSLGLIDWLIDWLISLIIMWISKKKGSVFKIRLQFFLSFFFRCACLNFRGWGRGVRLKVSEGFCQNLCHKIVSLIFWHQEHPKKLLNKPRDKYQDKSGSRRVAKLLQESILIAYNL